MGSANMPTTLRKQDITSHSLMATLHSFIKISLSSFLLLVLLSCFADKTNASEDSKANTGHRFHTLQMSSLLPDSTCTPSTGSSKRPSTLKVLHRHGPCSAPSQDKAVATPPLGEILSHDQSRVESIRARLAFDSNANTKGTNNKNEKADLPVQPGGSLGSGNYIVSVGLGTPKKTLSLVFDTGSDLTWTQCKPCAGSCYPQKDSIFDPSSSSSYSNISCASSQCSQLTSATGNSPGCTKSTKTCLYGVQYGDRSFSVGFFSKDTLTLTETDVFPNFLFGCGQNNQGLFGKTAGLLGLGRDPLSVVSQTASKYGKYFSYCLPSTSRSTGHLSLGKTEASSKVKFTPFASSMGSSSSFFFIDIVGISVGGRQLSIGPSVFKTAGTIIDSGTVITRLPPAAYSAMSTAFRQLMKKYPSAPANSILDTCYDLSKYTNTNITIPTISFTFGGNVKVDLDASGILIAAGKSIACLAFAGNSNASDVGIFGNTQQQTFEVVYDVDGGNLGFGAGGCN